jgi:Sigma-70, region 4
LNYLGRFMDSTNSAQKASKRFGKGKNQKIILKSLEVKSPLALDYFMSIKKVVIDLESHGFVEVKDGQVFLLPLGRDFLESLRMPKVKLEPKPCPIVEARKKERLEKSNQFLELYKKGLSYQKIGEQYDITRERVRQVLNKNPSFHEYLKEREKAESDAEFEKKERDKQDSYSKSLAALYPERVAELWDYEKNGDLKPEDVPAGTTQQYIWLKCRVDDVLGIKNLLMWQETVGREVELVDVQYVPVRKGKLKSSLFLSRLIRNLLVSTGIMKKITSLT